MKNYLAPIRMVIFLMGLALLLASCDDSEKTTAQPQVVRKKITAPADRTQPTPKVAAAVQSKPEAPAPEPKPSVAQVKPQELPAPAPDPTPPPKPKEPPPPTKAAATPVAQAPAQPAAPAAGPAATLPAAGGKKTDGTVAVTDAQMAALLNIQAPPPYNPKGKADPFEPFIKDEGQQVAKAMKPKKRTPQTPLEQIDLGQLKLVAIIAATTGNRALVEESSGKGYILREGTYVGMNSGKVVGISIDKVMIEEEFEDVYGKTITQKKEITLPKPPGEL
jgi:type IV pilus assembly protein PilP